MPNSVVPHHHAADRARGRFGDARGARAPPAGACALPSRSTTRSTRRKRRRHAAARDASPPDRRRAAATASCARSRPRCARTRSAVGGHVRRRRLDRQLERQRLAEAEARAPSRSSSVGVEVVVREPRDDRVLRLGERRTPAMSQRAIEPRMSIEVATPRPSARRRGSRRACRPTTPRSTSADGGHQLEHRRRRRPRRAAPARRRSCRGSAVERPAIASTRPSSTESTTAAAYGVGCAREHALGALLQRADRASARRGRRRQHVRRSRRRRRARAHQLERWFAFWTGGSSASARAIMRRRQRHRRVRRAAARARRARATVSDGRRAVATWRRTFN